MELIKIQEKLLNSGLKVFTNREFRRLLGLSKVSTKKLLEGYTKRDALIRLKRGIYSLKFIRPSAHLIANTLYRPSYISFESALSFHNMIPEAVHGFTSATTRKPKKFTVENQVFSYHKIKKTAFTGYQLTKIGSDNILIAEAEKALADYLYFAFLKKKRLNDRLRTKGINLKKLLNYARLFGRPKFLEWVKNVIAGTA
jgi:predicted transcriptional regulator of viral defense system